MNKFVIWGAGKRGKRVLALIGRERVVAFIDCASDKVGKQYCDKPIISFDEYQRHYNMLVIVISLREFELVENELKKNNIFWYFRFTDAPSELVAGAPKQDIFEIIENRYDYAMHIGLYGLNIFSLLLYEAMQQAGYQHVVILNNQIDNWRDKINQNGSNILVNPINVAHLDYVLVTDRNFAKAAFLYRNYHLEDAYSFLSQNKKYINLHLLRFKNCHNGERCFIVANGPSLRLTDLAILNQYQEHSFGMNMVYKAFQSVEWRPEYYVMTDIYGMEFYKKDIQRLELPNMFLGDGCSEFWHCKGKDNWYKLHTKMDEQKDRLVDFSNDITKFVCLSASVVYVCLQIAVYMGFKKIYIIGADCEYHESANATENHFIKDYYDANDTQALPLPMEKAFFAYQSAKYYADHHDVKIYNATRGGALEVFDRIDFDSLF